MRVPVSKEGIMMPIEVTVAMSDGPSITIANADGYTIQTLVRDDLYEISKRVDAIAGSGLEPTPEMLREVASRVEELASVLALER
jgi:hypothetical protein